MEGLRRALVAVAAGLALADASIVALALPPILAEMDTTISGVAAIVGVYAFVLAAAILPVARLAPERAGVWGLGLFAVASIGCGASGSLGLLLFFRALQAIGGAAALLAAFHVLDAGESPSGRRLWLGAALVGTAAGPAIGGALTEAFDWRAIFIVQAPIAGFVALACLREQEPRVAVAGGAGEDDTRSWQAKDDAAWRGQGDEAVRSEDAGAGWRGQGDETVPREDAAWREETAQDEPATGLWSRSEPAPAAPEEPLPPEPVRERWDVAPAALGQDAAHVTHVEYDDEPAPGHDSARVTAVEAPRPAPFWEGASPLWLAALACTAAAFTAVLFLLVIELVAGFALSPLRAAFGVTILPLAALAAAATSGEPRPRALAGAILIAGGAASLAFLPAAGIAWTIVPQLLAGAGMGLALPAFSDERNLKEAARNLVARHAGIVVVLAILAPVATAKLATTTERAILQGAALVLDAQIDPLQKLQLAPDLLGNVDVDSPRAGLTTAVEQKRPEFADDAAVYDRLAGRLDDVVVVAVQDAFRTAYLIAAALALLAAALLATAYRRPIAWIATALAVSAVAVYAVEHNTKAPAPVTLEDPCVDRDLPQAGGFAGAIQNEALRTLDQAACQTGTSREEFALALFDPERANQFEKDHGVNPRSAGGLLSLLGG